MSLLVTAVLASACAVVGFLAQRRAAASTAQAALGVWATTTTATTVVGASALWLAGWWLLSLAVLAVGLSGAIGPLLRQRHLDRVTAAETPLGDSPTRAQPPRFARFEGDSLSVDAPPTTLAFLAWVGMTLILVGAGVVAWFFATTPEFVPRLFIVAAVGLPAGAVGGGMIAAAVGLGPLMHVRLTSESRTLVRDLRIGPWRQRVTCGAIDPAVVHVVPNESRTAWSVGIIVGDTEGHTGWFDCVPFAKLTEADALWVAECLSNLYERSHPGCVLARSVGPLSEEEMARGLAGR